MTSLEMANLICGIIDEKKGKDIVKIEVDKVSSLCDYFIIASGSSTTNVKAIADGIEEKLEEREIFVKRIDGLSEGRWVAMDYGDVIVHIFNDETRLFYHLEKVWEQGKISQFMQNTAVLEKPKKGKDPVQKETAKKVKVKEEPKKEDVAKKTAKKPTK